MNATTRVRPVSAASRLAGSSVQSSRVDLDSADDELVVAGELEPGCDVPVVVEARDDDLVARPQLPAERPRQAKLRVVMFAPKPTSSGVQPRNAAAAMWAWATTRSLRRLVSNGAAEVRIRLAEVARHRVDHLVRDLGASGPVEEGDRPVEGGEPAPHGLDVERDRAHRTSRPFTRQR